MRVSQQILEWQAETRRADLLRVLEKHCKAAVPDDLGGVIQATTDMNLLVRWFDAALEANTFEEFRVATQLQR